ncbi:TMEM175 family protein [Mucilaginibacter ginsenosidivorans]|uniref:DUF1211 domain-containing protein n=1 Tax=Mucilaginibacter ginsenosidivorans TaxID=398053 RepID=A0A5B8UWM6_9SPHI|nr:TMEM175 family protein [Mucilaginibacter ginsenosidivorans]QEC62816.1 DUF1211 domain-containing protein [Mucilaginibacter ginsenosidivorans]
MKKGRLEAFSDGVIAIIITIMVLELKVPTGIYGDDWRAIVAMAPTFLTYALSFVYVGIYWNNHHHMFYLVDSITGSALWANLNLLFWLSLMPFATGWMGENHFSKWPVVGYGVVLIMCAVSYTILAYTLTRHHRNDSALALALGRDWKGKGSLALYVIAVAVAFFQPYIALGIYTIVAIIWFIPDRRIEKRVHQHSE